MSTQISIKTLVSGWTTALETSDYLQLERITRIIVGKVPDFQTEMKILSILIMTGSTTEGNEDMLKKVLDIFEETIENSKEYPLMGYILQGEDIREEAITYILKKIGVSFEDAIRSLMAFDDHEGLVLALKRIDSNFQEEIKSINVDIYTQLMSLASPGDAEYFYLVGNEKANSTLILDNESLYNKEVYDYLSSLYRKYNEETPIPSHIIPYDPNIQLEARDANTFNYRLLDTEEAVDVLYQDIHKYLEIPNEDMGDALKDTFRKIYEGAAMDGMKIRIIIHLLDKLYLDSDNNIEAIRVFGPSNPIISTITDSGGPNTRMFLCNISEEEYDDGQDDYDDSLGIAPVSPFDWFTEICEKCEKSIKYPSYAVRKPLPGGGWTGCYCSWKCVRGNIVKFPTKFIEEISPNPVINYLIDYFEKKIDQIGIYDSVENYQEKE